jgi:hypothetical protein
MSRMGLTNLYYDLNVYDWFESLLPDFILAFAFFTSISFAVLGKQFDHRRSAIAMSASIGFALSIGLVWWEQANDLSIRNLGTISIGFAVIVLAFVMYQSIRHIGGSWAGAGITLGASILITKIIGLNIPINTEVIQSITVTALIIGIFAFLMHTAPHKIHIPSGTPAPSESKIDMARLFRDRHLSGDLSKKMKKVRKEVKSLNEHPNDAGNVLLQIKRMLPAQGYLTDRMAQLRTKAHQIRNGHIARLAETRSAFAKMPTPAKKKASQELTAKYAQLIGIDTRLERLDKSVAENERRIRELTEQAQNYTAKYDYKKLTETLKAAEKLQKHNTHLIKHIEHTEKSLSHIAKQIAHEVKQNGKT